MMSPTHRIGRYDRAFRTAGRTAGEPERRLSRSESRRVWRVLRASAAILALFLQLPEAVAQSQENPLNLDPAVLEERGLSPAQFFREQGDALLAEERVLEASEAYQRALEVGRDGFAAEDRVSMAIRISWADDLEEAAEELRLVLDDDPENLAARTHLARIHSWSGDMSEAIDEADRVLAQDPEYPDALLVRADALRWQGRTRQSIPIYRRVVESNGDFDASLGLSYALLTAGERTAARENALALSTSTPRQEEQFSELVDAINQTAQHRIDFRYNYYRDSDENQSHRNSLSYVFGMRNHDFTLNYTRMNDSSPLEDTVAKNASIHVRSNLAPGLAVGGGIGVSRPGSIDPPNLMTGHFLVDRAISNGEIGFSLASDVLDDTTDLVQNQIRRTRYALSGTKPLTDRLSLSGGYGYSDFSDGNHSHDFRISPTYIVLLAPRITLGYTFRFSDYRGQTGSGYFDPSNYTSNRATASFYREEGKLYTYLGMFFGHQSYTRGGSPSGKFVIGGSGSIGYQPTENISMELNAAGSNSSGGSVTGFDYFTIGPRVWVRF